MLDSEKKRPPSSKRNKHRMEQRYNSSKVLDYKRTPSKGKKRTLNGSNNNSFLSNKRSSKTNIKEMDTNYSREQHYSDRRLKSKKSEKR